MPSGGLQIFGSGLQLQAVTPGVINQGNANISGTIIAGNGNFPGPPAIRADTGDTGASVNISIGDGQTWTKAGNVLTTNIAIGTFARVKANVGNTIFSAIAIGNTVEVSERNGIVIGAGAILGGPSTDHTIGGIVVGPNAEATSWSGQTRGSAVVVGIGSYSRMTVGGAFNCRHSLILGNQIKATCDTNDMGGNIIMGGLAQMTVSNMTNTILIFTSAASGYANTNWNATNSNGIIIGDTTHTTILLGGIDFSNLGGARFRSVADANANATRTDGTIAYSSISAARVVNLPLANAVPAGFRLLVVDQSGSASGVNTITLTRAGADTVNAGTTTAINLAYGCRELISDGVSKWTIIRSM